MEQRGNPAGTEVYVDKLPKCDFCSKPATYDAKTTMGPWAHMCEDHYLRHGIGLGVGKGQKLIPRKALGEAEKIRGEPPKELSVRMTEADLEAATLEDMWYPVCPYCGASTPAEPDAHAVYCQACNRRFKIINPFFSHSPISLHCQRVLEEPPKCYDFRNIRGWVMCRAWDILEKEKRTKLPVSEAWREARKVCER